MAFVEEAVLKIIDDSSSKIKKINSELRQLQATARSMRNMPLGINAERLSTQTKKLTADLTRIAKPHAIKLDSSALDRANQKAGRLAAQLRNLSGRVNIAQGIAPGGGGRGGLRGVAGAGFGGVGIGIGGLGIGGAVGATTGFAAARTAGQEVLARAAEETTLRTMGYTAEAIRELGEVSRRATQGTLNVTETRALAAARNLRNAGVQDEALESLTKTVAQTEAALTQQFGAEEARRITETNIKIADLAGALDNTKQAAALLEAGAALQITGGEDFNFKSFIAAVRTSGLAATLSADALVNFASAVDEQGTRAGDGLNRLNKVLSATGPGQGVLGAQLAALSESGIRGRIDRRRAEFDADPFAVLVEELEPLLMARGVDLVAARRGEGKEISKLNTELKAMGFNTKEFRLVQGELIKKEERQRDRARSRQVRFDRFRENAEKDIGLAMKALTAQFKDVAAAGLGPVAKLLAPTLVEVAEGLDNLARGDLSFKNLMAFAKAAGVATASFAVLNADKVLLGVAARSLIKSGGSLTSAAAALTRAAQVQGAQGGVGGVGVGGGGKGGQGTGVGRVGRGVGGGVAGAAISGAIELGTGGDIESAVDVSVGAFIVGVAGSLAGPVGTTIGSFIGAEIGRAAGPSIREHLGPIAKDAGDALADIPLAKFLLERQEVANEARMKQRISEIAKLPPSAAQTAIDIAGGGGRMVTVDGENVVIPKAVIELQDSDMKMFQRELREHGLVPSLPVPTPRPTIEPTPFAKPERNFDDMIQGMDQAANNFDLTFAALPTHAGTAGGILEMAGMTTGANIGNAFNSTAAADAIGARIAAAFNANARVNVPALNLNVRNNPSADTGIQSPN